jgi:hypothetical protein
MATEAATVPGIPAEFDSSKSGIQLDSDADTTYTESLCDSVLEYVHENGRRYVSERWEKNKYLIPNDESEQERMDIIHQMFLHLLGGRLHLAPLPVTEEDCSARKDSEERRALDLGTGTGIWAVEL